MNKRGIGFGFQTSQSERKQLVGNLAYDRYLNKHLIVRDDSVQRENVWADIPGKQESFLSHCCTGDTDDTIFHIVDIEATIANLSKKNLSKKNVKYLKRLKEFFAKGFKYLHIDGGNRTDTLQGWYENRIPLQYQEHSVYSKRGQKWIHLDLVETKDIKKGLKPKYTRDTLISLGGDYELLAYCIDDSQFMFKIYSDMDEDQRKKKFIVLNANEDLNREEMRNCSLTDWCTYVRNLGKQWKGLFLADKLIEPKNAKRFKFNGTLSALGNSYVNMESKKLSVDSFSPTILDEDYEEGTIANSKVTESMKDFNDQFNRFTVFIDKYVKGETNLKDNYEWNQRNVWVDFWYLFVYVEKVLKYKIPKQQYGNLFNTVMTWYVDKKKDKTHDAFGNPYPIQDGKAFTNVYNTTGTNGKSNFSDYMGLFGANTLYKLNHRFKIITDVIVPMLQDKGIIKKSSQYKREFDYSYRQLLWEDQGGKCALTRDQNGDQIPMTLDEALDPSLTELDHIIPFDIWLSEGREGSPTVYENCQLVFTSTNRSKGKKMVDSITV